MSWGDKDPQGPWGRPSNSNNGGGSNGGGGGQKPPKDQGPNGPDFDDLIKRGQDKFRKYTQGGGPDNKKSITLAIAIILLLWLSSGIYFVKADEQGVVTRFGAYTRSTTPGVNYHLPYPIENVYLPRVTAINHEEIGFRSTGNRGDARASTSKEESLMLTGDENILDIDFEVQWKISDAKNYLFNVRNPDETVKAVAESAMREVIGKSKIANVLAEGKLVVAQDTRALMQTTLDDYKAGIEVLAVNLLRADPPAEVLDAQRDVQTALADAQTSRNRAEAYSNEIVPKARGQAQKIIFEAEAYEQQTVARAKGEASRFSAVYNEFRQAKDITKKRMYLETMESVYQGMNKIIIDDKAGEGVVPYLPLPEIKARNASENN